MNPVIPLQWKDKYINKSILVNSTLVSNHKTAADYPSKLKSPLVQSHDNQQELMGSNVYVGPLTDRRKLQSQGIVIFVVNTDIDTLNSSKINESSKNDSNQLYINHINTLRTGLLNCLNARSRGLTFRHRASCI